MEGLNN